MTTSRRKRALRRPASSSREIVDNSLVLPGHTLPQNIYTGPHSSENTPLIAHGCLLIPMGIMFWWYWTKRAAHGVLRRLLLAPASGTTNTTIPTDSYHCHGGVASHLHESSSNFIGPTEAPEADQFQSWEEVAEQEHQDPSLRFVRWIKGKNHSSRKRLRAMSKRALKRAEADGLRKRSEMPILMDTFYDLNDDDDSIVTFSSGSSFGEARSHWQCIEDSTGFEMCELACPTSNEGIPKFLTSLDRDR
jgi:hypothetical protein